MKILISTPWFSPAFRAGGPVQSLSNLVNQKIDDLDFMVMTANTDIGNIPLQDVISNSWSSYNSFTKVIYTGKKGRLSCIIHQLKIIRPEVLFVNGIYSFSFTILPLLFAPRCKLIVSARGMLHPPALKKKAFKKKLFFIFFKPLVRWRKVIFHATDEMEKKHILSFLGNRVQVSVVQNIPILNEPSLLEKGPGILHLITVALIGPMKNHLKVLEALKDVKGEVHYHICGPVFDSAYWKSCETLIAELPSNIYIHYYGAVTHVDVIKYLAAAHVFICPSESENFGHALFEAMTAGKPLITSNQTPWNGLQQEKAGLNVDPEPALLAEAISFFLQMDNTQYATWSQSAATYARKCIDISGIREQYKQLFLS